MKYFLLIVCCSTFYSCKLIYGLKKNVPLSQEEIKETANRFKIINTYSIDSSYLLFLISITNHQLAKNHFQPLQALYYNKAGKSIASFLNCYAGGFPNLKWNKNSNLNTFPPYPIGTEDSISLNTLLTGCKIQYRGNNLNNDYTIVIFWNKFMNRQTTVFQNSIRKNISLARNLSLNIIYINNDNLFHSFIMSRKSD